MKKAFISLYIFIVFTLIVGGWSIDSIWNHLHPVAPLNTRETALFKLIEFHLANSQKPDLNEKALELNEALNLDIRLYRLDELSGLHAHDITSKDKVIITKNDQGLVFYKHIKNTDIVFSLSSSTRSHETTVQYYVFLLLFYLFLAAMIYLWIWPLFRDLNSLERQTAKLGKQSHFPKVKLKQTSHIHFLEKAFNNMSGRVEELLKQRKEMTYAVSHELRTPLARIKFLLEQTTSDLNNSELQKNTDAIKNDVQQLESFITHFLGYASFDKNEQSLHREPGDLVSFCQSTVDGLQSEGIRIEISSFKPSLIVSADWQLLERALSNLVENALRFANTWIKISVSIKDTQAVISVKDDGSGLSEDDIPHVFNAFVRGKAPSKDTGFGLGLAIVKRIAEWHGGSVAVKNAPEGGAVFSIFWPLDTE